MRQDVDGDGELVLRAATEHDAPALFDVQTAQDMVWWGTSDGDLGDTVAELDRVRHAVGSLEVGTRVAVVHHAGSPDGSVVGVAMLTGHGHTNLALDPAAPRASIGWWQRAFTLSVSGWRRRIRQHSGSIEASVSRLVASGCTARPGDRYRG